MRRVEENQTEYPAVIYFDESGYTGNNLLHPDQTIFSYGSVQAEPEEAREFVVWASGVRS